MPDVANLSVRIDADTSAAEKGLDSFGSKLGGVGGTLATAFGGAALAGIAGLAAGIGAAVTSGADFEKTMSAVKAVSGATAGEMESLSGLALQLGKDTSFSASEAGKGIEELVKGGLSIPDIMNGAAKATLDLAAAGGVSLPEAATIAANALAQFNLKGEDMGHVADLIAGAANASALDVGDFSYSLKAAGAVASTVGFSFDDLAQAIAVMGKAGITGSDAGTSLKTMMLNLQPSTNAQIDLFRDLGITSFNAEKSMAAFRKLGLEPVTGSLAEQEKALKMAVTGWDGQKKITNDQEKAWIKAASELRIYDNAFFDANGSVRSMAEVAQVLQTATEGMTDAQRIATLEVMFGSDAIRAGAVLAKEGAAGFNEMAESMGKVTAEAVGAERLNNLAGAWEQLKGSLETAAITIGLQLMPALTELVKWATKGVNDIIPALDGLGTTFGQVVAFMTQDGDKAQKAFLSLSDALEDTFGQQLGQQIALTLADIRSTIDSVMSAIAVLTEQHGTEISTAWNSTWRLVLSDALSRTQELLALIRLFASAAKGDWEGVWAEMTTISDIEQERQRKQFEAHADMMHAALDKFTGGALTATEKWMSDTGKAISDGWTDFVSTTTDGATKILTTVSKAWGDVKNTTDTVYRAVSNLLTAIWEEIYSRAIQPKLDVITRAVDTAWTAVQTKTKTIFDAVLSYLRDTIWEPIRAAVETKVNAARDAVNLAWQAVSDKAHAILDPVLAYVRDTVFGPMQTKVESASTGISTAFSTAVGAVKSTVDGALQSVKGVWESTWGAIQRAAESPKQAMQELINFIDQIKRVMPEWLIPHSPTPFQIGLEGIMNAARRMNRTFGDMTSVDGWLRAAMMHTGAPESWLEPLKWIVGHESSGNPGAKNPESTASGLFQMIDSTWASYRDRDLPNDVFDPILNAIGGIRYIKSRYGDPWQAVEFWKAHSHYAEGGWAGLHGPELAWLGERGPEYVVPNHALTAGGGGMQTLRVDVAIGGKVAKQVVIEGYDLAIRQGWTPGGLTG